MERKTILSFAPPFGTAGDADGPSLKELIKGCQNGEQEAWNEIFSRFIRLVVKTVRETLKTYGQPESGFDDDVVQDILLSVTARLKKDISGLNVPRAFPGFLKQRVCWETIGWLRKQNRKKNVLDRKIEEKTVFLDAQAGRSGRSALKDFLEGFPDKEGKQDEDPSCKKAKILECINRLDPEEQLIMKAFLMFYEPLSEDDCYELAQKTNIPLEEVRHKADRIMDRLSGKMSEREGLEGKIQGLIYSVEKLDRDLSELRKDSSATADALTQAEESVRKAADQLRKAVAIREAPIVPSYREISELTGIHEGKAKQIGVRIFRIRQKLMSMMQ